MNLFYRRPLLFALSSFIVVSLVSKYIQNYLLAFCFSFAFLSAFSLLAALIFHFLKKPYAKSAFNVFLCLFFCTLALINSYNFFVKSIPKDLAYDESVDIVARIDSIEYKTSYTTEYYAKLYEVNGGKANFNIELVSEGPSDLERGHIIKTKALFSQFSKNNYGFNERNSMISENVRLHAEFESAEIIGKEENLLEYFFADMRDSISKRIGFKSESAPLIKALLIGERSELERGTSLNFRRMGISHILSISGTHFTILLGMIAFILSSLGLGKKTVCFLLIPIALFYMGLTGFSAPVCRAGIMAIITYSAFLLGRMKDAYTALAISVTVILLVAPNNILSVSLWLSFSATFVILLLNELSLNFKEYFSKLKAFGKILFAAFTSILITVFISVFTLPIVAATFGEISIISPIANIILVPVFSLFLYAAPFFVIFPNSPISLFCDILYKLICTVSDYICSTDNLLISVKHSFVLPVSVICLIATVILIALPLKRKTFILLPSVVCIVALTVSISIFNYINFDRTQIIYFAESDNDGFAITSENDTMCIDLSDGTSKPAYRAEYISEKCYSPEIAAFLFTHYHSRHVSMFSKLCSRTRVQSVYLPVTQDDDKAVYMDAIAEIAKDNNIDIIWFTYGAPTQFRDCTLTVFEPEYISRSTHPVVNILISSKDSEIIYLGSSFSETDFNYPSYALDAEYVIFGQHSPIVKKEFSLSTSGEVILGSERLLEFYIGKTPSAVVPQNGEYEILLK